MTGGDRETSLLGQALRRVVALDAALSIDTLLERARLGPARLEVALVCGGGGTVPVLLTASPVLVSELPVICVVATDLGDQRAQAEL